MAPGVMGSSVCLTPDIFNKTAMMQGDGELSVPAVVWGKLQCFRGLRDTLTPSAAPLVQVTMRLNHEGRAAVLHVHRSTRVCELIRAAREAAARSCARPEAWPAMRARLGGRMLPDDETLDELWDGELGAPGGLVLDCSVVVDGGMDTDLQFPAPVFHSFPLSC